jgi:hypothetical protein
MSIELTFVGYKDSVPIYSPIDKKDQDALMGHAVIECAPKKTGTRTSRQNRAMHLFFARLVKALNDAGLDMKKVLKPEIDIPWSQTAVKEFLWKPLQLVITDKESTKDLNTDEVTVIYDALNRHLSNKFGVSVPFPEIYRMLYEQEQS